MPLCPVTDKNDATFSDGNTNQSPFDQWQIKTMIIYLSDCKKKTMTVYPTTGKNNDS